MNDVWLTGAGHVLLSPDDTEARAADPSPWLLVRKSRKYMGRQDDLAVCATGHALASAGLARGALGERAGLFLAVGYIPFERRDVDPVMAVSTRDGRFSMERFSQEGMRKTNPLLTFRCLPNMPAFHTSVNFEVRGPYVVTYPGAGAFLQALEEALEALRSGRASIALVGASAHQRNFLVEHHFARISPEDEATVRGALRDAASVLVLENAQTASERGAVKRGALRTLEHSYEPFDCEESVPSHREECEANGLPPGFLQGNYGPVAQPLAVSLALASGAGGSVQYTLHGRDGTVGRCVWELS